MMHWARWCVLMLFSCDGCSMWHCLAEMCKAFPEREPCLDGSRYYFNAFYALFSANGAVPDVQAAHTIGSVATAYHQRCRLLNCALIINWMVSLHFSLQDTASIVSKKESQIIWPPNSFPIYPRTILDDLWSREHGCISGVCSRAASSLHDTTLIYIYGFHSDLCSQTGISVSV